MLTLWAKFRSSPGISYTSLSADHCWGHPALTSLPRPSPLAHQIQTRPRISPSLTSYAPPRPRMAQHRPSPATRHPTTAALPLIQAEPSPKVSPAGGDTAHGARAHGPRCGGTRRSWRKKGPPHSEGGCSESGPAAAEFVQHRHLVLRTRHGTQPLAAFFWYFFFFFLSPPSPLKVDFTPFHKCYKYT